MFSGCVRYSDILDVVLEAFYAKDGKNVLKSERNLYAGKMRVMVNPFPAIHDNCHLLPHLLMYFDCLYFKQYGPRTDYSLRIKLTL